MKKNMFQLEQAQVSRAWLDNRGIANAQVDRRLSNAGSEIWSENGVR